MHPLSALTGLAAVPWLASFWTLAGAALVFGLGEALVTSSSAALVADLCRKRHYGAAMGTFGTIFDAGHASGPILGGVLVAALDFRLAFAVLAVVLLAMMAWTTARCSWPGWTSMTMTATTTMTTATTPPPMPTQ